MDTRQRVAKVIENPSARKGELAEGFSHPIAHSNHTECVDNCRYLV
nr:MAG TPA: hypothetical protein [Caudoviricetes sp.]DAU11926.1 MAG TPA: hypothetical protein [Caudoviricetes sp.]